MSELMKEKQREISRKLNHKPFMCIETGMLFKAPYEANDYYDDATAYQRIKRVMDGKGKTAYKCHWKYVEAGCM